MTEYNEIILSKSGHTSTVTLNRPNSLNSITPTMLVNLMTLLLLLKQITIRVRGTYVGQGRAFSGGG